MDRVEFEYIRSDRRVAMVFFANVLVVFLMGKAIAYFDDQSSQYNDIIYIVDLAVPFIAVVLVAIGVWLYRRNAAFVVRVSSTRFMMLHPGSASWTWSIPIENIEKIERRTSHHNHGDLYAIEKSGHKHALCPNYGYSRSKLFEALVRVNPSVQTP